MKISIPSIISVFLNDETLQIIKNKVLSFHKLSSTNELRVKSIKEIESFLDLSYDRNFNTELREIAKNFKYKFEIEVYSNFITNDKIGLGDKLQKIKFEQLTENLFIVNSKIKTDFLLNSNNGFVIKSTFVYFFN